MGSIQIQLEYKNNNNQIFKEVLSPEEYFDDYQDFENLSIESVPKYLSISDYVNLSVAELEYIKIVVRDDEINQEKVESRYFFDHGNSSISYNHDSRKRNYDWEVILNIQIDGEAQVFKYIRIQNIDDIAFIKNDDTLRLNDDGMESLV